MVAAKGAVDLTTVLTVGTFDGVHLGHRHLLAEVRRRAASRGARSLVVTFDPAPRMVLRPDPDYQLIVSPALGPRCRYHPTCSAYAIEALRSFGILRGLVLAGWRLLRCNPWSAGGLDPVEQQRLFRLRPSQPRDRPGAPRP